MDRDGLQTNRDSIQWLFDNFQRLRTEVAQMSAWRERAMLKIDRLETELKATRAELAAARRRIEADHTATDNQLRRIWVSLSWLMADEFPRQSEAEAEIERIIGVPDLSQPEPGKTAGTAQTPR